MGPTACGLVAGLTDWIEGSRNNHGRPRCPTEAAVETLRFFCVKGCNGGNCGPPGIGSAARPEAAPHGMEYAALLRRLHTALVRMVRSGPEAAAAAWGVVVDSCSVRAKRGGELTGPNPTDRAKRGTKYHVVVAGDGIPLAALSCAANVHDTMLFPALLRRALVVCAAIARLYADAGYDTAENRKLCAAEGILPLIRQRGEPHGSGLDTVRCVVERANAWLLANKRRDRRNDRLTNIIDALLTTACIFVIANRLTD
jgi:hypothetical protein